MANGKSAARDIIPLLNSLRSEELVINKEKNTIAESQNEPLLYMSTEDVILAVSHIQEHEIIQQDVKSALKLVSVENLAESLQWINSCLAKKCVMKAAVIEKTWTAFHQSLLDNLEEMTMVTKQRQASSILAFHVMKSLVAKNYRKPPLKDEHKVVITEIEVEIITYISGFLLKRNKNLAITQELISESVSSHFIEAIDRGGLTKPSEGFVQFIISLEEVFRGFQIRSLNKDSFHSKLLETDAPNAMYKLLQASDQSIEEKETLYTKIVDLFFIVRIHQKCRTFLDQYLQATSKAKKGKALRDTLN